MNIVKTDRRNRLSDELRQRKPNKRKPRLCVRLLNYGIQRRRGTLETKDYVTVCVHV